MKIRKQLQVAGKDVALVEEDIRLDLHTPGRAMFRVQAKEALTGLVSFSLGYASADKNLQFFTGYVHRCTAVDSATQWLFCKELAAALDLHLPLSLRHPTIMDVVQAYSTATGLRFVVPERPYANRRVPFFQTLGNGYHGMDSVGDVFGVPDFIWQQEPDGDVFVGSWSDTRWHDRPVKIAEKMFTGVTAAGAKLLPAVPALRPGAMINGQYLTSLQLTGHEMVLQCENSLNASC